MASYTDNLNLLKKDPATDGSNTFNIQTMLNDNWDKLDAAVGAARSAEEYDDGAAYAAGDYCTRDGKLYKCVTVISAGEPWNAAHWAETSVDTELKAMLAGLNGKAVTLTLTATIPASPWTASGGFYSQQVSVPGMLATDNPIADILPGSDNAANKLYAEAWGKVQSIDTLDGAVKFWCTAAPTTAFPVQFKVVRG